MAWGIRKRRLRQSRPTGPDRAQWRANTARLALRITQRSTSRTSANFPLQKMKTPGVILLALVVLSAGTSVAAPPAPDSEDARIMGPYKTWITSRSDQNGITCCEIGDGRPVDADIVTMPDNNLARHTYWRAHVTPAHFPGQPDHWVVVPDEKVVPGVNPIGTPILWLHNGLVQCFAPPDAF